MKTFCWASRLHYLITAGDKAAADDMIDILIPALLENQRLRKMKNVLLGMVAGGLMMIPALQKMTEFTKKMNKARKILKIFSPVLEAEQ